MLKPQPCPHCGRAGTLNRHSRLSGNAPDEAAGRRLRGQRVFCSNRGVRGGCGRTFSLFLADVLPRHSVPTVLLTRLLVGLLGGASLKAAAESLRAPFAVETFYRLARRLRHRLDPVRVRLCGHAPPPACAHSDPLLQTIAHLLQTAGAADFVATFQYRFQHPFLG